MAAIMFKGFSKKLAFMISKKDKILRAKDPLKKAELKTDHW